MILIRNEPIHEGITNLNRGDFFIDGEVVFLQQVRSIISVLTDKNSLYTIHLKEKTYSVFRITRKRMERNTHNEMQYYLRNCSFFL